MAKFYGLDKHQETERASKNPPGLNEQATSCGSHMVLSLTQVAATILKAHSGSRRGNLIRTPRGMEYIMVRPSLENTKYRARI